MTLTTVCQVCLSSKMLLSCLCCNSSSAEN